MIRLAVAGLIGAIALMVAPGGSARSALASPTGKWSLAPVAARTGKGTKPCYVGTHEQSQRDSKLLKALEAKGTVACEQPPRPNVIRSLLPSALANLG
jgi:hypothetical protein